MVLAFGDHRLDIERRELRRGADVIDLEPKAFDLLTFLVLDRDRVVTKDDLLQGVWGGRIVSESALTTRINAVRRALGDDGTARRLVRTFTRKGVRFMGEVVELPDQAAPTSDKPSIAVLPFQNMSGDPEQEYFVDGMVEEIITALSRFPRLVVPTSVRHDPPAQISDAPDTGYRGLAGRGNPRVGYLPVGVHSCRRCA